MRFEESRIGNILVARVLEPRIAADTASQFKAHLAGYLKSGERSIVLDLGAVTFIDSSGLGAIISSLKVMSEGGQLVISSARGTVVTMFKLTRMDKILRLFATNDEAAAAIS